MKFIIVVRLHWLLCILIYYLNLIESLKTVNSYHFNEFIITINVKMFWNKSVP